MNKKLLAVAIGAALSAPMLAQADVKVSGQLHLSADYMDVMSDWNSYDTKKMWNVSSNSSMFKIEVNEDLGGGMKAVGLIQEYVRMDNLAGANTGSTLFLPSYNYAGTYHYVNTKNTNRLTDGEAYVGLSGGFGTVLLGSQDSPAKKNGRAGDFFGNQIGDSRNLDVANTRAQNAMSYTSPTFAGVTIAALHSTNMDNSSIGTNPYGWNWATFPVTERTFNSLGVTYKGGPLAIGLAMDVLTPVGYLTSGMEDEKWTNLAASFDVGPATIKAFYQQHENVSSANNMDKKTMGLGASVKLGQSGKVKLQYYTVSDEDTLAPDTNSGDAKMIAVGYDHAFSKTFTGYVAVAQTDNDTNKRYSMAGGGHGDAPGRAPAGMLGEGMSGLSLGMILNF